ncbi:MAG: nucleotidyltransferase family protein [Fretibacterium sp.]|nr:nucleotidyltransferase family protein [Fretibacterium sp.]
MTTVQTLVLAAGLSRRMGEQKLLLPWGSSTLLETVLDALTGAGLGPVLCVLSTDVAQKLGELHSGVQIILNRNPERGQASSLRLGLQALFPGAFCLTVGDLPRARSRDIAELLRLFETRSPGLTGAVPFRDGRFGHPMFLDFIWKDRMMAVEGDRGGRDALRQDQQELLLTPGADGFFEDVDTPEDYLTLLDKEENDPRRAGFPNEIV